MSSSDVLVERFCTALAAVGGAPEECAGWDEALERAAALVGERPAVIDEHPDLGDLRERLRTVADPWAAEVGVTGALVAAADSGTLVLDVAAGRPRRTSLVPPVHVAVVPHSRLVATYADAVARVALLDPAPSSVHFITGPSRSADIEMQLVRGVHGPGAVHVLLYPA